MKLVTLRYRHPELGCLSTSIPIQDDESAYKYACALSALLPVGCTDESVTVHHSFDFNLESYGLE